MKKYHVVSAKKMGWDDEWEYFFFDTEEYTEDEAMAQFTPVEKETLKSNNRWYPYTAYEFEGETFYCIRYSGITDEDKI